MNHEIELQAGMRVRLPTAGKYCDRDIVITATGSGTAEPDPRELYQRVEYIESNGSQHIITDFFADNTSGIEAVITVGDYSSEATMGSVQSGGTDRRFYLPYPLGASTVYFGFNTATKITATVSQASPFRWQTNFLDSRLAGVYTLDGAAVGSVAITEILTPHTVPVAIFGLYRAADGGVTGGKKMKLYSARCSRRYEVVRDYMPCRRKSDRILGLYEKFTKLFLTSETGLFVGGPDIDWDTII